MTDIPIDIPPGLNSDDTAFASPPAWADGSNVRFRLGRPQVIGGWESLTLSLLGGVCRTVFNWTENNTNVLDIALGCHNGLQLVHGGSLFTVTPTLALPSATLGANPLTTATGTGTVVVAQAGHPNAVADVVTLSGAAAVGGITPTGNVTVTAVTTDTWTFVWGSNATSTATGGGSAVVAAPQRAFAGGAIDGAGSAGYGTGTYGGGAYGAPSTINFFAATWSLSAWGQKLLANPRGGALYLWANDTATPAAPIAGSPSKVNYALVTPQRQIMALGCSDEVTGVFNPTGIRHCDVGNELNWNSIATSASTARSYQLPGGGRIVAGRVVGQYVLIWTSQALWLATYVGQIAQVWSFTKIADKCGLIGPNAAVIVGSTAYWMSPDRQFHTYTLGGAVQPAPCPIRRDFADNLAASQQDKVVASSIAEFSEVRFDYPDARDGYENSRYIAAVIEGPDAGSWYRGRMARTAMVDAGPSTYPIGVTYEGNVYWHEKGKSADGGALSWSISTADMYLDQNYTILVRKFFPDFGSDQAGAVSLSAATFMQPGDRSPRTFGPYVNPAGQRETDMLAEGRLFQFTFSGNSAPASMRLGRLMFDAKQRGRR